MFIFRTRLVNTEIVNILSTNVIQFYCVTGVVFPLLGLIMALMFFKIRLIFLLLRLTSVAQQAQHWMQSSRICFPN